MSEGIVIHNYQYVDRRVRDDAQKRRLPAAASATTATAAREAAAATAR